MKGSALIITVIATVAIWLLTGPLQASQDSRTFLKSVELYRQGQYQQAIDGFLKIAASGINNGRLFYNLGNAYLKAGRLGHALLWYERALKLMPDDPDLAFNYRYAQSLTKDRRAETGASLWKIIFFWQHVLSARTIRWLAVAANIALWSLLLYRRLRKKKPLIKAPAYILFLCVAVLSITAAVQYYQLTVLKEGIILPDQASVRSGLSENATELFILHAGTKVIVERQKEGYCRIKFSKDKIGWLPGTAVGII